MGWIRGLVVLVLCSQPVACVDWRGDVLDGGLVDADGAGGDQDGGRDGDGGAGDDGGGACVDAYPGQVLISEVMVSPLAAPAPAGCWVELYNAGPDPLRMIGWRLEDGAGHGVDLELAADRAFASGGYLLVALEADPQHNGGLVPDLVVSGLDLASAGLRIQAGEIRVDQVDWSGPGWPLTPGAALNLDPDGYDFARNDEPAWWCAAWVAYGAGDLGTPGAANSVCSGAPECGNAIPEAGEQCDDGNDDACDGCLPDCSLHVNICGDGFACGQEACDDGDADPCDGCLPDCSLHVNTCGDGFECPPESCDDGNEEDGDGCSSGCELESGACPADMVLVGADPELGVEHRFCMDRYEASRPDATAEQMGVDTSAATSRAGVIPWCVTQASPTVLQVFLNACAAAGKRLCTKQEWYSACTGPDRLTYSFSDEFDPETCNCVDTFCDDTCLAQGIPDCNTGANCGYQYNCFHVAPTGQFHACQDATGAHDVSGNVWELVPSGDDPRGYEVRGGAFNCASASLRLQCAFNATWDALYAGFRCCADPP